MERREGTNAMQGSGHTETPPDLFKFVHLGPLPLLPGGWLAFDRKPFFFPFGVLTMKRLDTALGGSFLLSPAVVVVIAAVSRILQNHFGCFFQ